MDLIPATHLTMPLHNLAILFSGILILICGLIVLIRERGSRPGFLYLVYTLTLTLWFVGLAMASRSTTPFMRHFWLDTVIVGVSFIPAVLYHFAMHALERHNRHKRSIGTLWVLSAMIALWFTRFGGLLPNPHTYEFGSYTHYHQTALAFVLLNLVVEAVVLTRLYQTTHSDTVTATQRNRARILLWAIGIGAIAAWDFLPSMGIRVYPIGYVPIVCSVILTTYLSLRYRIVDYSPQLAAHQLFQHMREAVIMVDTEDRVRLINPAACDLFGLTESESHGKPLASVISMLSLKEVETRPSGETKASRELFLDLPGGRRKLSTVQTSVRAKDGNHLGTLYILIDVTREWQMMEEQNSLIDRLNRTLEEIRTLRGIITVCSSCRQVHIGGEHWQQLEAYIRDHTDADFSHGICPACKEKLYGDFLRKRRNGSSSDGSTDS